MSEPSGAKTGAGLLAEANRRGLERTKRTISRGLDNSMVWQRGLEHYIDGWWIPALRRAERERTERYSQRASLDAGAKALKRGADPRTVVRRRTVGKAGSPKEPTTDLLRTARDVYEAHRREGVTLADVARFLLHPGRKLHPDLRALLAKGDTEAEHVVKLVNRITRVKREE